MVGRCNLGRDSAIFICVVSVEGCYSCIPGWLAGGEVWGRLGPVTSSSLEEEDFIDARRMVADLMWEAFGHHYHFRLGKFSIHARWLAGGEVWRRYEPATSSSLEEEDVIAAR